MASTQSGEATVSFVSVDSSNRGCAFGLGEIRDLLGADSLHGEAAGGSIDSFFPALFAKLCQGKDLDTWL